MKPYDEWDELFEDEIRAQAHEIYERSGRVEGRDIDNWLAAEQIVLDRYLKKVNYEDGDYVFSGMPFEGSDY